MDIRGEKVEGIWDGHEMNSFAGAAAAAAAGNQLLQYERNLNFATVAMDDGEYGFPKKKTIRDPLSHRIIEKRRRDRMNNCLADLARLLPQASLRKGRGRIEKTEIVELAIKHLRHLQTHHPCPHGDSCELNPTKPSGSSGGKSASSSPGNRLTVPATPLILSPASSPGAMIRPHIPLPVTSEPFQVGFQECMNEAIHFLLESKNSPMIVNDTESYTKLCLQLVQHLNQHAERILRENAACKKRKLSNGFPCQGSDTLNVNEFNLKQPCSGGSISSGYRPNGTSSAGSDGNCGNDGPTISVEQVNSRYYNDHESNVDCDGDNSCSSTPLSIEVSDAMSSDGRNLCNGHSGNKLSVPQIVCGKHSPNIRTIGCPTARPSTSNCRSSDEGPLSPTSHRYKFKNTIKQRFTADTQTKTEPGLESNSFSKVDRINHPGEDQRSRDFEGNESESREARENRDQLVSSPGSEGMPEMSTCRNAFIPRVSVVDLASLAECEEPEVPVNPPRVCRPPIPAFVLHDNGTFYVPITLDRSAIPDQTFLDDFEELHYNTPSLPLHPVTISVCYTINKESKSRNCELPRADKQKLTPTIPVAPVITVTRDSAKVDIRNEIPKSPNPSFIMNRFEESQMEASRRHLNASTNILRHCPSSDLNLNYRDLNLNQHVYRFENTAFANCDGRPSIMSSLDNKGRGILNVPGSSSFDPLSRKDQVPTKSAFVGYKSWKNPDRLAVPADLSARRMYSPEIEERERISPRIRKVSSTVNDFNPKILSNGTCQNTGLLKLMSKDNRE